VAIVARMGVSNIHKMFVGKPVGKRSHEDLGIEGKIILEWMGGYGLCILLRIGISGGIL